MVLRKITDAGTSEPFFARMWMGMLQLRDKCLTFGRSEDEFVSARNAFDDVYKPVLDAITAARDAALYVDGLVHDHERKLISGEIVRRQSATLELTESIDIVLSQETVKFLVNGVIALKSTQSVTRQLGLEIGHLFQKQGRFDTENDLLRDAGHKELADYLSTARNLWSEQFIHRRNSLEHEGWTPPNLKYANPDDGPPTVLEPIVDGLPVTQYCGLMINRLLFFVEDSIVYSFGNILTQANMPFFIVEIPPHQRDPKNKARFGFGIKNEALPWVLQPPEIIN